MNKATIQALHKSIAHWNDICYGMEKNIGVSKCALCSEFNRSYLQCGGCPLMQSMQCCYDDQSAYGKYASIRRGYCTVDSADAAEAMLELLVSLLPDTAAGGRYIYNATRSTGGLKGYQEWFTTDGDRLVGEFIGITTDGRNAFPQAKYVWEKVFEYQVCGPLPEMPSYEWVADLPRAPIIWSWPEAKTKDGKCVTCGQVVKKKVTKYKVLLQGRMSGDICISDHYFASKSEFETALPNLRCIQLILETAKEFDA